MAVNIEVESKKLDNMLDNFGTRLEDACKQIVDELAETALKEIQKNYSKSEYQPRRRNGFY